MKMKGAKQVHYESGPNMTPLVDVVMVILIFLMLAGSFGSSEHFLSSSAQIHASGGGGVPPPPGWTPPTMLDVRVDGNGDVSMNGVAGRLQTPDEFKNELEKRMAVYLGNGHGPKDVEIVLHPGETTRWESLAPLYDAALRAKFEKVSFAMTGSK